MSALDALRRPEYTGENRCLPCTVVNAVAVVLASLVTAPVSGPAALVVLLGGAALIAVRGYVVPGTPAFAPRLVRALGLAPYFDHLGSGATDERPDRASDDLAGEGHPAGGDPADLLGAMLDAGVLREGDDGDLFLADAFADAWTDEMAALRGLDVDALAAETAAVVPFDATGAPRFDGVSVEGEGRAVWLRPVHAVADVAAVRAMAGVGVPESLRAPAASPLRLFLPECPACGGPLVETTVTDGCCGGTMNPSETPTRRAVACDDCGTTVRDLGAVGVDEERPGN
ncbi:hypothetical protein [Halobaculum lipolyticum]|uniref:Uncharacterized protein n=1 Tax=Halobaculum lipolyticum TaxID=3032001 RepID=A0ABD5WBY2_9EURY|nr:hypothetical protein [Halobaculum sp. DT31]